MTLVGTGFDISDQVTVNGLPAFSSFVDSNHIQVNYAAYYALQIESIGFTVISPYTGASNTYAFQVVNPVPVIQSTTPVALPVGGVTMTLRIIGTGFTQSSVAQWNGQSLSTEYGPWVGPNGQIEISAQVPATLLQQAGSATLTIVNPSPGGGVSNTYSLSISPTAPVAKVTINSSAASIDPGGLITLTAVVTANGAAPSGSVTFLDGTTVLQTGIIISSSGAATCATYGLTVGAHSIVAVYSGDGNYAPATSSPVIVTVLNVISPTVTVTPSPSTITTAQALTVAVAVSGGNGSPIPTGTVTLTCCLTYSSSLALSSGGASFNITGGSLPVGLVALSVSYAPDTASSLTYNIGSGFALETVNAVVKTTPIVAIIPSSSSITSAQGLTVTVSISGGSGNPAPSGSVTLTGGGYTSAAATLSGGSATISVPAGSLATGTNALTASYTPDTASSSTYNTASGTTSITVTTPIPPSFTVSGTAVSVEPGAITGNTSNITLTPAGGFTGSVTLTAAVTSSPAGAKYPPALSFGSTSPVTITGSGAGTAILTISTTAATNAALTRPRRLGVPWYAASGATLACLLLFGIPARRRSWRAMLGMLILLVSFTGGVLACGGGGNGGGGGGGGGGGIAGTTAGTYTITVTGTSGATTETGTVSLTVQ